jgi:hypothetical protein
VAYTDTTVVNEIVNLLDDMVPGYPARANAEDDLVRDLHINIEDLWSYFVPEIERRLNAKIPIDEWPSWTIREIADLVSRYAVVSANYCLVCGYDLGFPPWRGDSASHESCPCCGIEYGYHDYAVPEERTTIYRDWRNRWVSGGCVWRSKSERPPGWDAQEQLKRING